MTALALNLAWKLAAALLALFGAVSFVFFWLYAHPNRFPGSATPADHGLNFEPLKLRTSDGVTLDAWFVPHASSKKAVVVCHGYPMDKSDVLGLTHFLASGFNLLYFDFRATGRSGGYWLTGGPREALDIDAAVEWLKARGLADIGAYGFSMGAASVLQAPNPAIKARVADAPYAELDAALRRAFAFLGPLRRPVLAGISFWGRVFFGRSTGSVSPARAAAGLKTPVLLIHGTADRVLGPGQSRAIKAAAPAAELWIVDGAGHGETRGAAGAEYDRRVADFFRRHL